MLIYCNDYSGDVRLFFSADPNLIEGKFTNYESRMYWVDARLDNKFERIYAEIKNDKRNSLIISGNYGIQNYKDVMFQIKHYAGTTNYSFNLSNFPESCD